MDELQKRIIVKVLDNEDRIRKIGNTLVDHKDVITSVIKSVNTLGKGTMIAVISLSIGNSMLLHRIMKNEKEMEYLKNAIDTLNKEGEKENKDE